MVERSDFKMNKRGITLLALVITIVIMLLLAAVVIGKTCKCKRKWRLGIRYRTSRWWTRNSCTSRVRWKTK